MSNLLLDLDLYPYLEINNPKLIQEEENVKLIEVE
jgi:hypothetical protein